MKLSTDRILTTHVGSLPRPDDMLEALTAKMKGQSVDEQAFEARLPSAHFEAANPRHEHEWKVWETVKLKVGLLRVTSLAEPFTQERWPDEFGQGQTP